MLLTALVEYSEYCPLEDRMNEADMYRLYSCLSSIWRKGTLAQVKIVRCGRTTYLNDRLIRVQIAYREKKQRLFRKEQLTLEQIGQDGHCRFVVVSIGS